MNVGRLQDVLGLVGVGLGSSGSGGLCSGGGIRGGSGLRSGRSGRRSAGGATFLAEAAFLTEAAGQDVFRAAVGADEGARAVAFPERGFLAAAAFGEDVVKAAGVLIAKGAGAATASEDLGSTAAMVLVWSSGAVAEAFSAANNGVVGSRCD